MSESSLELFDPGAARVAVHEGLTKDSVCFGRTQPVVAGLVLVRDPKHGRVDALDAGTLTPRWSMKLDGAVRCIQAHGTDDVVFVTVGEPAPHPSRMLVAVDAATGTQLWTRKANAAGTWAVGNKVYVIVDHPNAIAALDARRGDARHHRRRRAPDRRRQPRRCIPCRQRKLGDRRGRVRARGAQLGVAGRSRGRHALRVRAGERA